MALLRNAIVQVLRTTVAFVLGSAGAILGVILTTWAQHLLNVECEIGSSSFQWLDFSGWLFGLALGSSLGLIVTRRWTSESETT